MRITSCKVPQKLKPYTRKAVKFFVDNIPSDKKFTFNHVHVEFVSSNTHAEAWCDPHIPDHGTKPEEFIKSNTNIFDFCGGVKIKGDWNFYEHKVVSGEYLIEKVQHTIRYFISKTGSKVIKKNNSDNREIQIEAGKWLQTLMIDYKEKPFTDYDINYDYYLDKIYKEIRDLEPIVTQLSLF